MKAMGSISLSLLMTGCLISCESAMPDMKRLIEQDIPALVAQQVENRQYIFDGQTYKLDRGRLSGWLIEELRLDKNGHEIYEERYKNKKENFLEGNKFHLDYDLYDPLSTYDFTVHTCQGWLAYVKRRYNFPLQVDVLSRIDEYCYHLMRTDGPRIYAYELIIMINKDDIFIKEEADNKKASLEDDLKHLKGAEGGHYSYDGYIFRMAKFVEPSIEYLTTIRDFALLQFSAKRYFAGIGILHAEFGKSRVLDTYILILTGKKTKVIIQAFYPSKTEVKEIENDLKMILGALMIKGNVGEP